MFERRGNFENIYITPSSNDGGIDIFMDETTPYGTIIKCGVECKDHIAPIGRPVIQKFHSALDTNIKGQKRGYIVTSGRFSQKAIDHTHVINNSHNDLHIYLIDGEDLARYEMENVIKENPPKSKEERKRLRKRIAASFMSGNTCNLDNIPSIIKHYDINVPPEDKKERKRWRKEVSKRKN